MRKKKILYIQLNGTGSAAVRSLLYKDLYHKKGYKVHFFAINQFFFFPGIQAFFPHFLDGAVNFLLRLQQYLVFHFLVRFYDGIVVMKFFSYESILLIRKHTKAKILYDFDDAIWTDDYMPTMQNYRKIFAEVDFISADNSYLADVARRDNKNVFIFPPPAQIEGLPVPEKRSSDTITIGWIGNASTCFYLYGIYDALEKIGEKYPSVKLLIMGSPFERLPFFEKIKTEIIPSYDSSLMNKMRRKIDIGIFPVFPCENSKGRGYCKAVIYMGVGIPVVATDFGSISELIIDGENGFLCRREQDWVDALSKLIENSDLRKKIAASGYRKVIKENSTEHCFEILEKNFLDKIYDAL